MSLLSSLDQHPVDPALSGSYQPQQPPSHAPQSASVHSRAMQRVMSQESSGSGSTATPTGSAALVTPATAPGQLPSSPADGSAGNSTPKASQAGLPREGGGGGGGRKDEQLAHDLGDLQMRSPNASGMMLDPSLGDASFGTVPIPLQHPIPQYANANTSPNGHGRTYSGSTDDSSSSDTSSSQLPSQLGSMYGAEGFTTAPTHISPYGISIPQSQSPEFALSAEASAAIARADEAVKALNGTSAVFSIPGPQPIPVGVGGGPAGGNGNPYQLPRGYAGFVQPQQNKQENAAFSRQSSTSSSTTEASTSSEEEDLCIPRIEWVDKDVAGGASANWASGNLFTPYQPHQFPIPAAGGASGSGSGSGNGGRQGGGSPARMPPPASTQRIASPRNKNTASPIPGSTTGSGGAHVPSALGQSSALPKGVRPDAMDEDDDDQTIGQRDKSPGTSSASSQSGLDLLIRAVTHSSSGKERPSDIPPESPVAEGKGKRKAGAEAVDQWRNSGIPTGVGSKKGGKGKVSTTPEGPPPTAPPSKKRRRSSAMDEKDLIDPILLEEEAASGASTSTQLMQVAYDQQEAEGEMLEEESEPDDGASEGDSEYGGDSKGKKTAASKRTTAKRAGGRGRTSGAGSTSKAAGGAGGGRKGKKATGISPSGAKGGKTVVGGSPVVGGVQCEYTNPLPPFNRCQDVFTRKYDLPRHMARHARREGELVYEGKLPEDKALLWQSIKDRPKVSCESCGESFTRMDALKRHQAKQHH